MTDPRRIAHQPPSSRVTVPLQNDEIRPAPAVIAQRPPTLPSAGGMELRRRNTPSAGANDPESAAPAGSRATTTGASLRDFLRTSIGSTDSNPITATVAFVGYQPINRTATGPLGAPQEPVKRPPIDPQKYEPRPPPTKELRLTAADFFLRQADAHIQRLTGGRTETEETAAPTKSSKREAAKATAKVIGKALVTGARAVPKSVGIIPAATPTSADAGGVSKAGRGGRPDLFQTYIQLDPMRAKVRAADVLYGSEGVRIAVDKLVAYMKKDLPDESHDRVDAYVEEFRARASAFHNLDARLANTAPEQEGRDALLHDRNQAHEALRRHQTELPQFDESWRTHLITALDRQSEASHALAAANQTVTDASNRLRREEERRLTKLVQSPPGLERTLPALTTALKGLEHRLLNRYRAVGQLAPDAMMEITLTEAVRTFGKGADAQRNVAEAIARLGDTDVVSLARQLMTPGARGGMLGLAAGVATLPRGVELLAALCKPSRFLAPIAASESKADERAAADLGLRRMVALQTLSKAVSELAQPSIDNETRAHLERARDAAFATLSAPACNISDQAPAARYAFNAVRNDLVSMGSNSAAHSIDAYLKELSDDMLNSTSRAEGLAGAVARVLPSAQPTPLSPRAIDASATTLMQVGLIVDTLDAVTSMRESVHRIRTGDQATPQERALHAAATAMENALPSDEPERLASLDRQNVDMPDRFGLDDAALKQNAKLNELWTRYSRNELAPTEAVRELATQAQERLLADNAPEAAKKGASVFRYRLDLAHGSAVWQRGSIDTPQQLAEGLVAIARLLRLRNRLKFTGGNLFGFDLSKVPIGVSSAVPLNIRLNLSGRVGKDRVIEIGMSTQAYYLTVGSQTTVGGRVGGGLGVSPAKQYGASSKQPDVAIGGRVEVGAAFGAENQYQNGVLLRVPRDKATEKANLAEFEQMVRHAIDWQGLNHTSPLEGILSNVDATSVNLLGKYDRMSYRGEASVGGFPLQLGSPKGHVQSRFGAQARWQGDNKSTTALEATGHYQYQDLRKDHLTTHQRSELGTTSLRVANFGPATLSTGDMLGGTRTADWPGGAGTTRRIVTMDGEIAPLRTRLVIEHSDLEKFRKAMDNDKARWINHGNSYTKFPAGFTAQQELSEDDYEQFFDDAEERKNPNKQYLLVYCLKDEMAPAHDALAAKIEQAKRSGDSSRVADLEAQKGLLLDDPASWEPRRSVINGKSAQISQPGYGLGVVGGVSGNTEGVQNEDLLPRA